MTLACEDADSKLVDVVTFAEVDAKTVWWQCRFGSSILVIKLNFCSAFEHKFGKDFKVEDQAIF